MRVRRLALFVLCVAALAPVSSAAAARATAVPSIFCVAGYQAPGTAAALRPRDDPALRIAERA